MRVQRVKSEIRILFPQFVIFNIPNHYIMTRTLKEVETAQKLNLNLAILLNCVTLWQIYKVKHYLLNSI